MVGSFGTKLRKTQKLELKARSICKNKKKGDYCKLESKWCTHKPNSTYTPKLGLRKEPPPPFQ